tara:strand:- start:15 stop:1100 length:1086 start_codon:yes stop_codon:yes gene_type:complete
MAYQTDVQATRSALQSVDTTLSANISATQDFIPVASTTNFSTSVVAEIESTNEVVSFTDISQNLVTNSVDLNSSFPNQFRATVQSNAGTSPFGTSDATLIKGNGVDTGTKVLFKFGFNSPSPGDIQTFTIFAKDSSGGTGGTFQLEIGNSAQRANVRFNITNGARTGFAQSSEVSFVDGDSVDFGNGYFRFRLTVRYESGFNKPNTNVGVQLNGSDANDPGVFIFGAQVEETNSASTYLQTSGSALLGLTGVTRGVNGTTAASASSGDSIQQLPYALSSVDMPVRLKGVSISSDGTGAGRLTLCDNNGNTLCDIDIPNGKIYTLFLPDEGIVFPNGVFVSNTINVTGYTVFTAKYSGPNLT